MNQSEISEKTGIAQSNVSRTLKSIRELSFIPSNVRAILECLGWEIVIIKGDKK